MRNQQTSYTIGKLAEAAGVPTSTVRYYEQRGLVQPDARSAASYRLYGPASLERLRFVRAAQRSGFTLEDIGKLLEIRGGSLDPCGEVQAILERRLERVEEQVAELERVRGVLRESITWCAGPHADDCCPVIDELDAGGAVPTTVAELAGALYNGLRGGLVDARLYVAVKRLLARGRPVRPEEVADVLEEPLEVVLGQLARLAALERDAAGNVTGWGLTLNPTEHRFEVEGRPLFTWCALDTLFFPALLGRTAVLRSACPATGVDVVLRVRPDAVEEVEPATTVVSLVLPAAAAARRNVRRAFCDQVHWFRDEAAGAAWLEEHPGGLLLPVERAFEVGKHLSARILAEAGEACDT